MQNFGFQVRAYISCKTETRNFAIGNCYPSLNALRKLSHHQ